MSKLNSKLIAYTLTQTADTLEEQIEKTEEELTEWKEAQTNLRDGIKGKNRITLALSVAMEMQDVIKSSSNELRLFCEEENLNYEKVIQLNDLNNDVRNYHK